MEFVDLLSAYEEQSIAIDGDTFTDPNAESGEQNRIRISGVNTPETGQPGAQLATDFTQDHLDQGVDVERTGDTTYNRDVAEVSDYRGDDLAVEIIRQGLGNATQHSNAEQAQAELTSFARGNTSFGRAVSSNEEIARRAQLEVERLQNPVEFDPSKFSTSVNHGDTFEAAIDRGVDGTQSLLYSAANAIGEFTGFETLAEWGEEGTYQNMIEAAANPAEIESWDDVNSLAEFGTYVVQTLGEQAPNLALMAGGSGAVALATRAAIGKKLVTNAARARLLTRAAVPAGAFASSYPLAIGEVNNELKEGGIDSPGTALLMGIPIAALDAVSFDVMLGSVARGLKPDVTKNIMEQVAKGLGLSTLKSTATEVPTEVVQELLTITSRAIHDPNYEVFTEENAKRLKEVAIKAGIVGTAFGAAGGVKAGIDHIGAKAKDRADLESRTEEDGQVGIDTTGAYANKPTNPDVGPAKPEPTMNPGQQQEFDFGSQAVSKGKPTPNETIPNDEIVAEKAPQKVDFSPDHPEKPKTKKKVEFTKQHEQETRDLLKQFYAEKDSKSKVKTPGADLTTEASTPENESNFETLLEVDKLEEGKASFNVKNKASAARALATTKTESANIVKNDDGTYSVQGNFAPNEFGTQDFDASPEIVVEQVAKIFEAGQGSSNRRVEFFDTNKKKPSTGKSPKVRANIHEVVNLGFILSGKKPDYTKNLNQQVRNALSEGLAFMQDKGYQLTTQKQHARKGKQRVITGIPKDTIVFGKGITWGKLASVSKDIQNAINAEQALEKRANYRGLTKKEQKTLDAAKQTLSDFDVTKIRGDEIFDGSDPNNDYDGAIAKQQSDTDQARVSAGTPSVSRLSIKGKNNNAGGKKPGIDKNPFKNVIGKKNENRKLNKDEKLYEKLKDTYNDDSQVRMFAPSLDEKVEGLTKAMLKHLGMSTRVRIVDEIGAVHFIEALRAENTEVSLIKAAALEQTLNDSPSGRVHYFDNFDKVTDRVPVIFISMNNTKARDKFKILAHEFGHLVQRAELDSAPSKVKEKLEEAHSNAETKQVFDEWFANQMYKWVLSRETPRNLVDKFFKGMVAKLRKVWNYLRARFPVKLNDTFAEYMDGLVIRAGSKVDSPLETKMGKQMAKDLEDAVSSGPFLAKRDLSPQMADHTNEGFAFKAQTKIAEKVGKKQAEQIMKWANGTADTSKKVKNALGGFYNVLIRSADARLRSMKSDVINSEIADHWHHRPGNTRKNETIPQEINRHLGQFITKLEEISETKLPRKYHKFWDTLFGYEKGQLDKDHANYKKLSQELLSEKKSADQYRKEGNEAAAEIRDYLDNLYKFITKEMGLDVREVENYFPHVFNVAQLDLGREKFLDIITKETKLNSNQAVKLLDTLLQSEGVVMDIEQQFDQLFGPSFAHAKERFLSKDVQRQLQEFYIDDIAALLASYTHAAVKRAVIQHRFNPEGKETVDAEGKIIVDPMLKANEALNKAFAKGEITAAQKENISSVILEAYMGRLGNTASPKLRAFNGTMIAYQNLRLLSWALLSSLVDVGHIGVRAGNPFEWVKQTAKYWGTPKEKRKQLFEQAKLMGHIRDDLTDHILNDQLATHYYGEGAQKVNESFFRAIRMHQWTNWTRVMAMTTARDFMRKHAESYNTSKDSKRYIDELGVSPDRVKQWVASDYAIEGFADMTAASHQFVDESIIRPGAAIRPAWGSDPHWQIFWHLKQFMWGYHETILRRVWSETKSAEGFKKALPLASLAIATLPLAAAGYELRRQIGYLGEPPEHTEKEGWDYWWEVTQRAGIPGVMQLYVDAEESEQYRRLSVLSPFGPTVGQFEEFLSKDFDHFLGRALPGLNAFPAVRRGIDW